MKSQVLKVTDFLKFRNRNTDPFFRSRGTYEDNFGHRWPHSHLGSDCPCGHLFPVESGFSRILETVPVSIPLSIRFPVRSPSGCLSGSPSGSMTAVPLPKDSKRDFRNPDAGEHAQAIGYAFFFRAFFLRSAATLCIFGAVPLS